LHLSGFIFFGQTRKRTLPTKITGAQNIERPKSFTSVIIQVCIYPKLVVSIKRWILASGKARAFFQPQA
jgi:hypothetical protein